MSHMNNLEHAQDDDLEDYIPDVYQENIYAIDYKRLKEKGIKLLFFDVDDTIIPSKSGKLPKLAINKFNKLRSDFKIVLISNSKNEKRIQRVAEKLGVERYVANAEKPVSKYFKEHMDFFELREDQIAHIGNSVINDVGGGNTLRFTTCLVRPVAHEGDIVPELERRKKWRKHHREQEGDQYYQLGETQKN